MNDGTEIQVVMNANPYTKEASCIARIKPKRIPDGQQKRAKAGGPFIWVGLRDNRADRDPSRDWFKPFMAMWEPGKQGERQTISGREVGGQVLHPEVSLEGEGGSYLGIANFPNEDLLVHAIAAPNLFHCGDIPNPYINATGHEMWKTLDAIPLYSGDVNGAEIAVRTESGLIGMVGGFDPTATPPGVLDTGEIGNYIYPFVAGDTSQSAYVTAWNKWEMSYFLDPNPAAHARMIEEGFADQNAEAFSKALFPTMHKAVKDRFLQQADAEWLAENAVVLKGSYLLKLGVVGLNYRPGECTDYDVKYVGYPFDGPSQNPTYAFDSIPVTVKIVTGRGEYMQAREFNLDLRIPAKYPVWWKHRYFPVSYEDAVVPSVDAGDDGNFGSSFVTEEVYFNCDGPFAPFIGCHEFPEYHDTGTLPSVSDPLSQYELETFKIDPYFGAERTTELQPWGFGE